jgi:hypothetical protein
VTVEKNYFCFEFVTDDERIYNLCISESIVCRDGIFSRSTIFSERDTSKAL